MRGAQRGRLRPPSTMPSRKEKGLAWCTGNERKIVQDCEIFPRPISHVPFVLNGNTDTQIFKANFYRYIFAPSRFRFLLHLILKLSMANLLALIVALNCGALNTTLRPQYPGKRVLGRLLHPFNYTG